MFSTHFRQSSSQGESVGLKRRRVGFNSRIATGSREVDGCRSMVDSVIALLALGVLND